MKQGIHPKYGKATVTCGCGNTWETRATKEEIKIEVCSKCHPFYTGQQRLLDTAGRIEKFQRKYGWSDKDAASHAGSAGKKAAPKPEKPKRVRAVAPVKPKVIKRAPRVPKKAPEAGAAPSSADAKSE